MKIRFNNHILVLCDGSPTILESGSKVGIVELFDYDNSNEVVIQNFKFCSRGQARKFARSLDGQNARYLFNLGYAANKREQEVKTLEHKMADELIKKSNIGFLDLGDENNTKKEGFEYDKDSEIVYRLYEIYGEQEPAKEEYMKVTRDEFRYLETLYRGVK